MSAWTELRTPCTCELVIGIFDLRGYTAYCQRNEALRALEVMAGYTALAARIIEQAGGRFLKAIGDAGLFVFFADDADMAIDAVQKLQSVGDAWLRDAGYGGHVRTALHAGSAAVGRIGAEGREQLDVIGSDVNIVGAMRAEGRFAVTPAFFRKLSADNRKLFRKHTPPVSYIGLDDPRPDA